MDDKQIKIGAVLSYSSIGMSILVGLLYTPWMVEQIGESSYGLYTLANSLITLFLFDFGLSTATSRFISKYVAEGNYEKANSLLGAIYKLYVLIDAIICAALIIVFFSLEYIYISLSPEELQTFKVVYCISAGYSVISFPFVTLNGVLTSFEKFIQLKFAEIIQRFLSIGLTFAVLYHGLGLYALVASHALTGLIMLVYKCILVRKYTPARAVFRSHDVGLYRSLFSFSLWSTVALLAQRLIFTITPTLLGIVSDTTQIAIFGIVTTIEGYCYTITTAINGMFLPKISRIYAKDSSGKELMPLMLKVGRFQFFLNGLLVVGFIVLGQSFVRLWMGESFSDAYYGIVLVILPGLFYNSLQVGKTAMVVQNKVKEQAYIAVVCGVLNIAISLVVSYFWGAVGACVSIFIAYCAKTVLYHIVMHRRMQIDILKFMKACYLKMSPPAVLTLACGLALNYFIPDAGWLVFLVKGCLVVAVYCVSMFMLGLSRDEKRTLKETILKHTATKRKA